MITPTLRLKLSDFIDKPWEQDVLNELSDVGNEVFQNQFSIYFWYDRNTESIDLSRLSQFLKQRENEKNTKKKKEKKNNNNKI